MRLRYFCSPQHTDSALYPIISQMERAAGFIHDDSAQTKLDKLNAVLGQTSTSAQDAALFAEMLSLPNDGRYPTLDLTPEQRRQRTLQALVSEMEELARQKPLLMIFEDAHWTDPTSLELFGQVVDRVRSFPVLLLVTFRQDFDPPWVGRPYVTFLVIVSSDEIRMLIEEVTSTVDELTVSAQQYKAASLDLDCADPAGADAAQKAAMLERQRLIACRPRLEDHLRSAVRSENRRRGLAHFRRVEVKLKDAAEKFAVAYPEIVDKLIALFKMAKAVDQEVDSANASATGDERLVHVEVLARNLPEGRFTREQPEIALNCVLPDFEQSSKQAWPPPRVPIGVLVAASMAPSYSPARTDQWATVRGERDEAIKADQQRVAEFYDRAAKEREEREAREAREAQERQR
jgi:hypothetical protein